MLCPTHGPTTWNPHSCTVVEKCITNLLITTILLCFFNATTYWKLFFGAMFDFIHYQLLFRNSLSEILLLGLG
ncbi:dubious [Schizosaccharomyces pombe]|uniref:Putative uncharacterized protein C806.11 n=1 Tax=Schizosaccharomyces pombe (strain 972 / ATCC 24843) TaxID=284812 RepID=YI9B_SCHPO|nr:uncharacterized protein SPAC806.11 [Schizosaccharomyces pombe]A6X969.1 RecName: Full=Putative uncharacterized protein C806.11 [Schizosaccharomyces pombe 972h-]CAO77636.1 dubious [Schizosaccharomyces pombe]|eukprot:NP_001343029.1 uncharacterized protein SPAC806.11 [Schizosaccharomyces pombe]